MKLRRITGTVYTIIDIQQLVKFAPLLEIVGDWRVFLDSDEGIDKDRLRQHERTGRPLGLESFVKVLEVGLNRMLCPQKPEVVEKWIMQL